MTVLLGYAELLADGVLGPLQPGQTRAASLMVAHAQQLFTALDRPHPDQPQEHQPPRHAVPDAPSAGRPYTPRRS